MEYNSEINLASKKMGAKIVFVTDDFFAPASRMLQDSDSVWIGEKFDNHGKWMDGWESRRKRVKGHDFCIVKLAAKSTIDNIDLDTSHFTGNFPPEASIDGLCISDSVKENDIVKEDAKWFSLLATSKLNGDSHNVFKIKNKIEITHIRLNIYPDGGIARLRVYGQPCFDDSFYNKNDINVASIYTGATAIYANDEHFGRLQNILFEHTPINMADGWETRRRREPGNDWGIIKLAKPAIINSIVVDTKFFKGNYPNSFDIQATYNKTDKDNVNIIEASGTWSNLIDQQKLTMDSKHSFNNKDILINNAVTHIRLNIYPDGGISRLKLIGKFINE